MSVNKQLYTLDQYLANVDTEKHNRVFELMNGELFEKKNGDITAFRLSVRLTKFIDIYNKKLDIGYVTVHNTGYILSDRDVFIPDVGFISKARLLKESAREVPVPPDLAVEVKSSNNWKRTLRRKAERYIELGTRMVWLVFPDERTIEVYRQGDMDVETIGVDGTLDGGEILPGFSLAVHDIFALR
jgi:Uma2 family endonuclease